MRLIHRIGEKQHGGSLLVLPNNSVPDDPNLVKNVNVKYRSESSPIWDQLVERLTTQRQYYDLRFKIQEIDCAASRDQLIDLFQKQEKLDDLDIAISDSIQLIAGLSSVDGAVVVTDRFCLLGFGVEILSRPSELNNVYVATDPSVSEGYDCPIESLGTRHRSAFRFCYNCENAAAIVVSQDGGAKAVRRVGDKVVMWHDIIPAPHGP